MPTSTEIQNEINQLKAEIERLSLQRDYVNEMISAGRKVMDDCTLEFRRLSDEINQRAVRLNQVSNTSENLEDSINALDKTRVL